MSQRVPIKCDIMTANKEEKEITYKLCWQESETGSFSTATGSGYEIKEGGILVFFSPKPIILSPRMKYIIK